MKTVRTSHSSDLQSPVGHTVPPGWRPCPADWSPAALGVFPSVFTDRDTTHNNYVYFKKIKLKINRQLHKRYVMVKSNLEL